MKGIRRSARVFADLLAEYLKGLRVKVNLIPYNPQRRDRFAPPEEQQREAFLQRMRAHGYQTLLRGTKGRGMHGGVRTARERRGERRALIKSL